jgi:serine phosphatase RsbU (regulator of sigma subunit)
VLGVVPADAEDVDDPTLRHQCGWFAHYLGHLLQAVDRYGDALEAVRRRSPRNVGADLVSHLLPPLTAGTDKIVVSGRVEPADRMGGDVFDYALSASTAHLGIIDGTGHDLHAGLVAALAVAACRNARREGRGLFGQLQAVQDALVAELGTGAHATGVLARLDLDTGNLRYICAGHPYPVVMRHGRPVRTLLQGRRPLLGVDTSDVVVGQERLEPEDLLVLYTDGITEARDLEHRPFGLDGLTDLLAREHAATTSLPETVRRVLRKVVRRGGGLQDDATLLLAHWTRQGQALLAPTGL